MHLRESFITRKNWVLIFQIIWLSSRTLITMQAYVYFLCPTLPIQAGADLMEGGRGRGGGNIPEKDFIKTQFFHHAIPNFFDNRIFNLMYISLAGSKLEILVFITEHLSTLFPSLTFYSRWREIHIQGEGMFSLLFLMTYGKSLPPPP